MNITDAQFWTALLQIIGINIMLSGDNAVVIALAARSLPAVQQRQAIRWGSGAAVVMRIVLTLVAVKLLELPWLKLIGAVLLLWIALQLLLPEDGRGDQKDARAGMMAAIKAILAADLVMSLDNVLAVAGAANGSLPLLIVGLAISIPLVVFASTLLLKLMSRWPIIITLGAALLGWVAGEMMVSDVVTEAWIAMNAHWLHYAVPTVCTVLVVVVGKWLGERRLAVINATPLVDLAAGDSQQDKP